MDLSNKLSFANYNTIDPYSKFSSKAEIYHQYRWDYHPDAMAQMCQFSGINQNSVVADIGSGTGMLTAQLVSQVKQVYAIEPNEVMRNIAIKNLAQYPAFLSVDALADATTLPDHSVDLIVVGRAIHWFNPKTTKPEFLRILKPNGWLAICQVPCQNLSLLDTIDKLQKVEYGWNIFQDKSKFIDKENLLEYYFSNNNYRRIKITSVIEETWQVFLGRISSLSPAPNSNNPLFHKFKSEARKIFDLYSEEGILTINNYTEINLGTLS